MKGREEAHRLLEAARRDLTALENMRDPSAFSDEVFGFHAQQAVEKSLKSWLALLAREYPLVHDLSFLLRLLEDNEADVERFWGLLELNAFAVQFRYEAFDGPDAPLSRDETLDSVRELVKHVEALSS